MEQPDSLPLFEKTYGKLSEARCFAPGRINIIGEHVDYNEGLVLPTPLAKGVSVSMYEEGSTLNAISTLDGALEVRQLDEGPSGSWTDYILGAMQIAGVPSGAQVSVDSNLPAGASVSSSAALLVATLRALNICFNLNLDRPETARLAQRVENEFLGLKSGLMDQMVSSCGTFGKALLFDTQSGQISDHDLIPGTSILTIHSGQDRRLVGNEYNARRESCERAATDIGIPSLRGAALEDLGKIKNPEDMKRARHVISEHDRTLGVLDAIARADATTMGKLITECHDSLSSDFEVSTPAMDAMVQTAVDSGALGARMTGAGFGGCIIVLTETEIADQVRQAILSAHPKSFDVATLNF